MAGLASLAAEPGAAGLFLDIDGVLAPIVEHPEDALVPPETRSELVRLAGRYALVAAVTGRPSDVARVIVGVPELRYVGEHGLELDPDAKRWVGRVRELAEAVAWPDTEMKPLSVAFHYRAAPDPDIARVELEAVATRALADGLKTRWGRMVLEVLPPVAVDKGTAVRTLLAASGLRRALYAGDDTTDLNGFDALDGLDVAVRVAVVSQEGPLELAQRADVTVASTEAFLALLREL